MAAYDYMPTLLVPNTRGWIVGPTYDLGEKEFRLFWDVFIRKLKWGDIPGIRKAYNLRTGEMFIEFPWNSSVQVRSAQKPDSLVGDSLDWVIMSEAAKLPPSVWEKYVRPSLADKLGSATFPTTPEGFNWIYDLTMYSKSEPDTYDTWNMPSWENPFVYPGGEDDPEIQLLKRTTPKAWYEQEIAAKFVSFYGQIFDEFDSHVHVRKHTYKPEWRDVVGIDFGFTNPFVYLDMQIGPSGQVAIWREYYVTRQPTWVHATVLKRRDNPQGYKPRGHTWADPEDPDAIATLARALGSVGARAVPWQASIMEVKRLLLSYIDEDSKVPMLTVDPSCTNTIREFNRFRVKDTREGLNAAEVAEKVDDHAMSALRYAIYNEFGGFGGDFALLNPSSRVQQANIFDPTTPHMEVPDLASIAQGLMEKVF